MSYKPIATPGRLEYSLTSRLTSKQKMAITVFLQSTATSASGKFTTEVKGAYDGKSIRSQATTWIHVPPPRSTCTDWDTISFGEFRLENNVWGGPTEKHLQCVTYHPDSFGWNVSRLNPQGDLPYYPEVIYGKKPWQMDSTTGSLPVPVTSIKSLEISLLVSMEPYSRYNLAFDLWITNQTISGPDNITDEIMIWLIWTPGLQGTRVHGTVDDGYNKYEHRTYDCQPECFVWRYHQFTILKQGIPSRINVLPFLDHLMGERNDLRYLASIELGNEVWSGKGETKITRFDIHLDAGATTKGQSFASGSQGQYGRDEWSSMKDELAPAFTQTQETPDSRLVASRDLYCRRSR